MSRGNKRRFKCRNCGKYFIENGSVRPAGKKRYRADMPSASRLILELRAIYQRTGKTPTTTVMMELSKRGEAYPLYLYYTIFDSFLTAQKRARLKGRYRQEFDEGDRLTMLNQLRTLSAKLKRPLFAEDVAAARKRKEVSPLNHFFTAFGLIPKAIELAGVAPKRVYTRDELIAHLRKVDATADRPVTGADLDELYDKGKGPSRRQFERMFGSMVKARKAAKVKNLYKTAVRSDKYWTRYTVEEVITQLKALGEKLGRKPTDRDINKASGDFTFASAATVARMFGGLPEAYRAAGFEKVRPRSYTENDVRAALKKLEKELGRFPLYEDILAASIAGKCPSPGTVTRRLGKLTKLRSKSGYPIPKTAVRYTDEQLISALKRKIEELGRFPEYRELAAASADGNCPSPSVFLKRFGAMSNLRKRIENEELSMGDDRKDTN